MVKIIEDAQIPKIQQDLIKSVTETTYISDVLARSLLMKFEWNAERVTQRFFDDDLVKSMLNYDRFSDK